MKNFAKAAKAYFENTVQPIISPEPSNPSQLLQKLHKRYEARRKNCRPLHKERGGWQYDGKSKTFIPEHSGLSLKQQCMLGSLLCAEGNWSAINAYDNQIFTLGMGFSAKGMLPIMLLHWFEKDPTARTEIKQAGIPLFNSKRGVSTNWEALAKSPEKMNRLIAVCEAPEHNSKFIQAQIDCLVHDDNGVIVIPDYAKDWDLDMLIAGAHFSHWMRNLNWHIFRGIYEGCYTSDFHGNAADVIRAAYKRLGKNKSIVVKNLPNDACMVPYRYGIHRILTWGDGDKMVQLLENDCWKGKPIQESLTILSRPRDLLFQTKAKTDEYLLFKPEPTNKQKQ